MADVSELKQAMRRARQGGGAFPPAMTQFGQSIVQGIGQAGQSLGSARQAIQQRAQLIRGGVAKGEVNVLGERVRLEEEGFDPARFTDVVSFSEKYFPNSDKINDARVIFSKIFALQGAFDPQAPVPPADSTERELLEEGIRNRFESLRLDILKEKNEQGDTASLRAKLDHLQRLVAFLDRLDDPSLVTADYNEDGTIKGPLKEIDAADEERMKALLRTFAFMVLQGVANIPGQDAVLPGVDKKLEAIEEKLITQDELDMYLQLFENKGFKLPATIADVLSTTKISPGLLEGMVAKELEDLYTKIVDGLRAQLAEDTQLRTDLDVEIAGYDTEGKSPKERIQLITLFLLNKLIESDASRVSAEEQLRVTANTLENAKAEVIRLNDAVATVTAENEELTARLAAAEADAAAKGRQIGSIMVEKGQLERQLANAAAACEDRLRDLRAALEAEQANSAALEGTLDAANRAVEAAREAGAGSQAGLAALTQRLAEAESGKAEREAKLQSLEGLVAAQKSTIQSLQGKLRGLTADKAALEEAKGDLETRLAAINAEITTLRSGATGAAGDLADRDARIAELEGEKGLLHTQKADVDAELNETLANLEEKEKEFTALQAQLEAVTGEAAAAGAAAAGAEEARAAAAAGEAAAMAATESARGQAEVAQALNETKQKELEEAQADLEAIREAYNNANMVLNEATSALESAKAEHTAALNDQGRQAAAAAAAAAKDKAAAEAAASAATATAATCAEKLEATLAAAAAAEKAKAAAEAKLTGAGTRITSLQAELDRAGTAADERAAGAMVEGSKKYNQLLGQLKAFSEAISEGRDPGVLIRGSEPFATLFTKIQGLKGAPAAMTSKADINRLYCLFAYYVNVFLHMLFLNNRVAARGIEAFRNLLGILGPQEDRGFGDPTSILDRMNTTEPYKSAHISTKLYTILDALIPYVQGIETFLMYESAKKNNGFYRINAKSNADRSRIFATYIYPALEGAKDQLLSTVRPVLADEIEPNVIGFKSAEEPILFISKPAGEASPSFLYTPNAATIQAALYTGKGYTFNLDLAEGTERIQPITDSGTVPDLQLLYNNKFLTYELIVGLFLAVSQQYIKSIEGTIKSICPIPIAITDPIGYLTNKASRGAAASQIQAAWRGFQTRASDPAAGSAGVLDISATGGTISKTLPDGRIVTVDRNKDTIASISAELAAAQAAGQDASVLKEKLSLFSSTFGY